MFAARISAESMLSCSSKWSKDSKPCSRAGRMLTSSSVFIPFVEDFSMPKPLTEAIHTNSIDQKSILTSTGYNSFATLTTLLTTYRSGATPDNVEECLSAPLCFRLGPHYCRSHPNLPNTWTPRPSLSISWAPSFPVNQSLPLQAVISLPAAKQRAQCSDSYCKVMEPRTCNW